MSDEILDVQSDFVPLYGQAIMDLVYPNRQDTGAFRNGGWRTDVGESAFVAEQLVALEQRVYEYKLRDLGFRRFFPVSNIGEGSETIAYDIIRGTGIAKIVASGATDIPRADVFVDRNYTTNRSLAISFGYTTQELRKSVQAGVALESRKAMAAKRGMDEALNKLAWFGDTNHNILGILNNPNISQSQAAAPATGTDRTWAGGDKTALEIISDVTTAFSNIVDTTNNIHHPNTVLLPTFQYEYLVKTPYSDRVPKSIMSYLTDPDNRTGIEFIEKAPELKASGPAGEDQMLVYEKTREVLEFFIPMELKALPPEQRGLEFVINMESECAGLVVRYPLACSFTYGI